MPDYLKVSVAYVGPITQFLTAIEVRPGTTVREAIAQTGVLAKCPEIDLAVNQVGIFGKLTKLDQALADGDRIEIYRPLIADPKEARKRRASEGTTRRQGEVPGTGSSAAA